MKHQSRGMQGQTCKIVVTLQIAAGAWRAIALVPNQRMAGQDGMTSDLVGSAGVQTACDQAIVFTAFDNTYIGPAGNALASPLWIAPASCFWCQRPLPAIALFDDHRAVDKGLVVFDNIAIGKLPGQLIKNFAPAAEQDDPAGLLVQTMHRVNSEIGIERNRSGGLGVGPKKPVH